MTQTISSSKPVWRDMDQKALDDAYDQDVYAPNRPLIVIAASQRVRERARSWASRSGSPTVRANTSGSISSAPRPPTRRSIFSSMAEPGGATRDRIITCKQSRSLPPGRIASSPISSTSSSPAVICFRCTSRCAAPSCGRGATRSIRRRPRPVLYFGALVGLASCRLRADARVAGGGPAGRFLQGCAVAFGNVRPRSRAAVEALVVCEIHRRDGGANEFAAPTRRPAYAARACLRHAGDTRIPASDARVLRRCAGDRRAGRADAARLTIISSCSERWPIPMGSWAARCCGR